MESSVEFGFYFIFLMKTPKNESSSISSNNIASREELKMKMLLAGGYDFIHRETGKMIQKKQYKKAFGLLEKFYQTRKDLDLAEMIQINRRIINCVNKILKIHLIKPEPDWESEQVLINIVQRGTQALSELYKYINIYVQKVLPSDRNNIV